MINAESINWPATKAAFDQLYSQAKVARRIEVSKATFCEVLNGIYAYMGSDLAQKILCTLDQLGVLVFKETMQP